MIRLFLLIAVVVLLVLVGREARRYFVRDRKLEEYKDTVIDGEIADIELDIAMEEHRKNGVKQATNDINSNNKKGENDGTSTD